MSTTRRAVISAFATAGLAAAQPQTKGITRYVRFKRGSAASYGILQDDTIQPIRGDLFGDVRPAGTSRFKLSDVTLLYPIVPPKVLAVGLNYKSHIGTRVAPANPELFFKPTSCLTGPGQPIVIPSDSQNTHYEGELVIVIGKPASRVTRDQARDAIFGVTCGNDVSERDWQNGPKKDLQWWRAKGADTFGPCGPCIVRGVDYGNLMLRTRLNGDVVQEQSTSDLLFDCPSIVSFASRYVALAPGDLIYTGTPGSTKKMKPGDVVEVEIEGVGTLRNPVVAG
ncbi:MAG TPA: fumarylacetoacetate hydrolase family protein [Bryobacteraceae bacterium]|nr:fumarylacetoacetate hydrolase family protein [Bryobacteraceae bacterium]